MQDFINRVKQFGTFRRLTSHMKPLARMLTACMHLRAATAGLLLCLALPLCCLQAAFAAADDASGLAGQWQGRMEPTNLSAGLELSLSQGAAGWTAELVFRAGDQHSVLPVGELIMEADKLELSTTIEGAEVLLDLQLEDNLLLGTVQVTEQERLLAAGPVGLARSGDEDGQRAVAQWIAAQGTPIDDAARSRVISRASELFLSNYVFEDAAQRAVADVSARAGRGEYNAAHSAPHFAELLSGHLAAATGDRHVRVKYGAERYDDPLADSGNALSSAEREEYRQFAATEGYGIGEVSVLEGNIGYLQITRFFPPEIAGDALAAAMSAVTESEALIIDLRSCRGGEPGMVVLTASWLFAPPARHWNDVERRCDGTHRQFWTSAWLPGPRFTDKPVYVLTAGRTFSAPESLAYELQQTGRATIVGEVTGGGAHPGAWFPIDDHFAVFIPLSRYISAVSGGDWEGSGVVPDLACPASEALERTLELHQADH